MSQLFDSYWPLVEPMFDAISIDDPDSFYASSQTVPRASLLLFASHFCLSEVWNGGLQQFFFNSTGLLAPEAIDGFRVIGMPKFAGLLAAAASCLGPDYPRARKERWDAMVVRSGLSEKEVENIFDRARDTKDLYTAFRQVCSSYGWDRMTDDLYVLGRLCASG